MRFVLAAVLLLACGGADKPAEKPTVTDRDWTLAALGDQADPIGMGGKPITLRLDSATSRASGFAGCNQYSGPYALGEGKLSFGPTMSTRMFCRENQKIEDEYLKAFGSVSSWELAGGVLTLRGGAVLRFK